MSVDLYVEQVIVRAKAVAVRLIGGLDYWRYGCEELSAACRANGIPLALLPGDGGRLLLLFFRTRLPRCFPACSFLRRRILLRRLGLVDASGSGYDLEKLPLLMDIWSLVDLAVYGNTSPDHLWYGAMERHNNNVRALVPPSHRLVTWASSAKQNDKCFDAADVLSFNEYPGWYTESFEQVNATWANTQHDEVVDVLAPSGCTVGMPVEAPDESTMLETTLVRTPDAASARNVTRWIARARCSDATSWRGSASRRSRRQSRFSAARAALAFRTRTSRCLTNSAAHATRSDAFLRRAACSSNRDAVRTNVVSRRSASRRIASNAF